MLSKAHTNNVTEPGRNKGICSSRQQLTVSVGVESSPGSVISHCNSSILTSRTTPTAYYTPPPPPAAAATCNLARGCSSSWSKSATKLAEPHPTTLLASINKCSDNLSQQQQQLCSAASRSLNKTQAPQFSSRQQKRRISSQFRSIPLLTLLLAINCCLLTQAFSLKIGISAVSDSSSLSEKLFESVGGVNQISNNQPEQAQLVGSEEAEKSLTTRGIEFVTRIFKSNSRESNSKLQEEETIATQTTTQSVESSTEASVISSEEENERSSSEDDDDDAEGCKGISAHESAKGKNLSDAERLVNLQSCIQGKVKRRLLAATRSGMEIFEKLSLSGGCTASLMNLMSNLAEIKSFAFKFIDASAKVPSGMMYGLLSDFGDFDQCLSARSNPNVPLELEAEESAYSGKYCLMSVKLNYHVTLKANQTVPEGIMPDGVLWDDLVRNYWTSKSPKGFQVGMCFPSRCTNDDLDQLYRHVAESYNVVGEIISCQDSLDLKHQYEPDLIQRIIINTFYALIIVTIIGTFVDRYYPQLAITQPSNNSNFGEPNGSQKDLTCCSETIALAFKVLMCFSISKNWRIFIRKDHIKPMRWGCLNSRISSSTSDGGAAKTVTEGISVSSSTLEHIDPNFVVPIEKQEIGPLSINSKYCQLTVKIQPDDYVRLQEQGGSCLSHLSGLRLLVIFWITIGHSFLYPSANNYQYYRSIINMNITRDSVWFATTNFTLGIDMLLYITGLVFVYKLAQSSPKLCQTNRDSRESIWGLEPNGCGILRLISKKILRFWPTYVTVIAFAIVVPLFSDGPMWPEMVSKRLGASCRQNWWANLLFINNFLSESEICLPSSWFVSVSMQLFLIGSVVVVLERRYSFSIATIVLGLMLVASCTYSFLSAYFLKLRAPVIRMDETFVLDVDENIWRLYINIFNNLGPFLIGMAGGYLLLKTKARDESRQSSRRTSTSSSSENPNFKSKSHQLIYEILIGLLVLIIAILVLSSVFHKKYSILGSSIYWSFHRIGWAIVTGYIIHNCATGRWQLINDLLSLSTLIPISRLVFIAYLVYPIYIHLHSGLVRDGLHVSIYNMFNIYITRLVLTFSTALFIHLLVELPFCSIEEIYLNRWVLKIENESRRKDSSKFHPLLAVAPIVSMQLGNELKQSDTDQLTTAIKQQVITNTNPQIANENTIDAKQLDTGA